MTERNQHEYLENEQYARQEVYEAFKRGVLQAPQVDIGGVLETASAAFGVAFDSSEKASLATLDVRLSNEQLDDLRKAVAHAHAANGVMLSPEGYESMFPDGVRTVTDDQLEGIWISCADKSLVLLENIIYAVRQLNISATEEEMAGMLLRGASPREKSEYWLNYSGIRSMAEECLSVMRGVVRSPEFKQAASAWKTKIRDNPANNAYRSSQQLLLTSPVIDLLEQGLRDTGILDLASKFNLSPREMVAQMLQPALL